MTSPLIRIAKQVQALAAEDEGWYILPDSEDDSTNYMNFVVEIEGPTSYTINPTADSGDRDSPYKGGLFRVQLIFPATYPNEPPSVLFKTRIWHPQISVPEGKPCVDVLTKAWKSTMTVKDVLLILRQLMANPSKGDAVNADAAAELESLEVFEKHAREETAKWAIEG